MDCLTAGIEYKKDYYEDGDIKPKESLFFSITLMPFGGSIDLPGVNKWLNYCCNSLWNKQKLNYDQNRKE